MMSLIAIPAFSKFGKRAEFNAKVDEIESTLNQMHIMALNPEKGQVGYAFKMTSPIEFSKVGVGTPSVVSTLKNIELSSGSTLTVKGLTGDNYLLCEKIKTYCCKVSSLTSGTCATAVGSWLSAGETWTYLSATQITVPTDATTKYSVGDQLKFTNNATIKNCVVASVAETWLTVSGDAVEDAPITANSYTKGNTLFTIQNDSQKADFSVYSNPFRVKVTRTNL